MHGSEPTYTSKIWHGYRRQAIAAWLRMLRFVNESRRTYREEFRRLGLSPAQFDVIAQVGSRDGLTQSELADRLFVTQGNITQLLDKMQRLGLVVRRTEGRSKRLALTERGRMLYREVVPRHEESVARKFSALSETELRMLARVMRKLNREEGG